VKGKMMCWQLKLAVFAVVNSWAIFVLSGPLCAQPNVDGELTASDWQQIDASVERALRWLASQQQRDGSFPTLIEGQPGVTSLCVMAFATHGHLPGEGPYGDQLQAAIDYVVRCQKPSGVISLAYPSSRSITRNVSHEIGSAAAYNHAFASLLLSEVYAMTRHDLASRQAAIEKALQATLTMQRWPKPRNTDIGGWRYIDRSQDFESDLSVTGWQLMFLRSAKNAGFDVPKASIDSAVAYVRRCFQPHFRTFTIMASPQDRRSRGMAGAGILALAHAGLHDTEEARIAGDWILREGFANYNESRPYGRSSWIDDRYHYSAFCASQAMYQLGGENWNRFYPATTRVILANQSQSGSWAAERHHFDGKFGPAYTTALMTMTLGATNQLLPIFQR